MSIFAASTSWSQTTPPPEAYIIKCNRALELATRYANEARECQRQLDASAGRLAESQRAHGATQDLARVQALQIVELEGRWSTARVFSLGVCAASLVVAGLNAGLGGDGVMTLGAGALSVASCGLTWTLD